MTTASTVLSLLLVSITLVNIFLYNSLTITAIPQTPGIVFQAGSCAGQPDIGNNLVTVNLGASATDISVIVHPTYQETYYKDIFRIVNNNDDAINIYLVFDSVSNTLPTGNVVKLLVYEDMTKVKELDITNLSTGAFIGIGTMRAGGVWQVDLYIKIPEGTYITGTQYRVIARLVYTSLSGTLSVPLSDRHVIKYN
ncbi:MAG: hypothetical protein QW254_04675 [Desulfurococcaceae archaeon]